jgi:hypothetical protein
MCRKFSTAAAGASRVAGCLLLLSWLAIISNLPTCYAAGLPVCQPVFQGDRFNISRDCSWTQQRNLPSKRIIVAASRAAAMLPALNLAVNAEAGPPAGGCATVAEVLIMVTDQAVSRLCHSAHSDAICW